MSLSELNIAVVARAISCQVDQITCTHCGNPYVKPATANCGHTLCFRCWTGRNICPVCSSPYNSSLRKLNIPLRNLTDNVKDLVIQFEKLFNVQLTEFALDFVDNEMETDSAKQVKDWLTSSQNHFSVPPTLSTQQQSEDIMPVEVSASNIQIDTADNKVKLVDPVVAKIPAKRSPIVPSQDDWDKIEVFPDSEDMIPKIKEHVTDTIIVDQFILDENEYTTDNPRRSCRKRDNKNDHETHHGQIDKHITKKSVKADEKCNKSIQHWSNVKKMKKEFSKTNKTSRNKLNISIEMCKNHKNSSIIPTTVTSLSTSEQPVIIDDNTPNLSIYHEEIGSKGQCKGIKQNVDEIIPVVKNPQGSNTNELSKSDEGNSQRNLQNEGCWGMQGSIPKKQDNKNPQINIDPNELLTSNILLKNNQTNHQKTISENDVIITQEEVDLNTANVNSDDIEISIKFGSTVTNILIKKKENNVQSNINTGKEDKQLKTYTDQEVQTSFSPYTLPTKKDSTCSPIPENNLQSTELLVNNGHMRTKNTPSSQLSKSILKKNIESVLTSETSKSLKKNTNSADTASVHFEITDSVEKELSDMLECVETDNIKNVKSRSSNRTTKPPLRNKEIKKSDNSEIVKFYENVNDLDIFGSGSVKEKDVKLLKNSPHVDSEILMPTSKSIKSQKVADKRDREIEEAEMPCNKKQKLNLDVIEHIPDDVISQEKGDDEAANDSERMNYDVIMSQVFANIDADMNGQNSQKIKGSNLRRDKVVGKHTQVIAESQSSKDNDGQNKVMNTSSKEVNDKYSENVFSVLEKDSEYRDIPHGNNQPPISESTHNHIKKLLTPGMCRNLITSIHEEQMENDAAVIIEPIFGTPMLDPEDSESVVEETPQKNLSFSKLKQKSDSSSQNQLKQSVEEPHVQLLKKSSDSQFTKSVINISDTLAESTKVKDTTVLETKKSLDTPLTINKFVNQVQHYSTPMARKSLNFDCENVEDPEVTLCTTSTLTKHSQEHTLCPTTTQEKEFLAKAFDQTPKSPVQTPLRSRNVLINENKKLCLAASCLSVSEINKVKALCAQRNWTFVDNYTKDITHLVVGVDEENKSLRSVKYMCALAASKWIVSYTWVEKSLRMKCYVNEKPFEALDSGGDPAPQLSRLAPRKLFHGFLFYCMPPFNVLDEQSLKYILEAAGGRVVDDPRGVTVIPDGPPALLLAAQHSQDNQITFRAMEFGIVPVNFEWVFNCLGSYSLCPLNEHLLCPFPLLPQATHRWPEELLLQEGDYDLSIND